jgi:hypothetical protein
MLSGRQPHHNVKLSDVSGMESVPETSEDLHILTRLSAREHFTELLFFSSYSYSPIYQPAGLHTHPSTRPSVLPSFFELVILYYSFIYFVERM